MTSNLLFVYHGKLKNWTTRDFFATTERICKTGEVLCFIKNRAYGFSNKNMENFGVI